MSRLPITKTPKCFVGGAFIRSESGRVKELLDFQKEFVANIPLCTRKDLRNAVESAAKGASTWAGRNTYNRGQILYRMAEMLEARADELAAAIALDGTSISHAKKEVSASIDRIVHYAGWTDKFSALLSSVNPVSSAHFNFTVCEPMGVVGVIAPHVPSLLGLISLTLPVIVSGNSCIILASPSHPYPAILLGEIIATSDLPAGVVNILTGERVDMLSTFATHEHIRALCACVSADEAKILEIGAAESVKRVRLLDEKSPLNWSVDQSQGLEEIRHFIEFKTTWHPVSA